MDLVFAGTPEFSVPCLEALLTAGHRVRAVYTQPDRPAGRGRAVAMSPVKQTALQHGLAVRQPTSLKSEDAAAELKTFAPDVMIVVAYGLLLPLSILTIPRLGCINVHASRLPRWRGAAPIARAIEAGDDVTGITIMQMEEGLDTGPMLLSVDEPIHANDTGESLHDRLAILGAKTLVAALDRLARGELLPVHQDDAAACYARKLKKEESTIDWSLDATRLHCRIRAFNPWPVAATTWRGERLRIWDAALPTDASAMSVTPGTIVAMDVNGITVATGSGTIILTRLQRDGGRPLTAREFANGTRLVVGERLG